MSNQEIGSDCYLYDLVIECEKLSIAARIEEFENKLLLNNGEEHEGNDLLEGLTIREQEELLAAFKLSKVLVKEGTRRRTKASQLLQSKWLKEQKKSFIDKIKEREQCARTKQ